MESRAVLERGHVYFFYRPRVEMVEAHAMADVQRLYMLIVPQGHEEVQLTHSLGLALRSTQFLARSAHHGAQETTPIRANPST